MGALEDRLVIKFQAARLWLGLPLTYESTQVQVSGILSGETAKTQINGVDSAVFAVTDFTAEELAAEMADQIDGAAEPVSAVSSGSTYIVTTDTPGTPFQILLDSYQDLVPGFNQEDQTLAALIAVALQMSDQYLNNDFVIYARDGNEHRYKDESGDFVVESLEEIPEAVEIGVLQVLVWLWQDAQEANNTGAGVNVENLTAGQASGDVRGRKAGDLSVTYATAGESQETGSAGDVAGAIGAALPKFARTILDMYRYQPGA